MATTTPTRARRAGAHLAPRVGAVALAGAALLLTACGSDDDDAGGATTTSATSATSASSAAATTATPAADAACVQDIDAVVARAATDASLEPLPADLVATLDEAVQTSFPLAAAPGAIVGVQTPEGTWMAAYGDADPVGGTPMEVGMHTRIGSVTKTFTGTVLMQLVEQGVVSLDDMTSGLASYTRSPAFTDVLFSTPEYVFTPDEVLASASPSHRSSRPGAGFDYSNTNTVLLGKVIEAVTGQPVEDVFQELVFDPLGLTDTSWPGESTELPEPYAQGFTLQGNAATPDDPSNATHWNPAWGWTAGELISDLDDLLVYGRALGTGRGLLGADAQAERLASFPGGAGYGIGAGCVDGWIGHDGTLPGYNTSVYYDTTSDTTVVVQTNSEIASGQCAVSPTLIDDPGADVCASPATRILVALTTALGHPFTPVPLS